jgi:glycosyltransferase involved in cell wall biosynthesis
MERVYAAGDLLVHPTFFDSFANVVLEAMSCGLPAVVSDCAGAAELIDGRNGLVLPVASADADDRWAAALAALIADPARRAALGAAARVTASAHGYPAYVAQVEDYLTQAAAATGSR